MIQSRRFNFVLFSLSLFMITLSSAQFSGTWTTQSYPIACLPWSVKATSSSVCWISADSKHIYRTTDGGLTWVNVADSLVIKREVFFIDALDSNVAIVTTTPNDTTFLYRTTNGGKTWQQVYFLKGGFIDGIHMFDSLTGVAISDPVGGKWGIIKTTDGGATWSRTANEPTQVSGEFSFVPSCISFAGISHFWFSTRRGVLYKSTDRGENWEAHSVPFRGAIPVCFIDSLSGFITETQDPALRKGAITTDGGNSWDTLSLPGDPYTVFGAGTEDFWFAGDYDIYHSTDLGKHWTKEFTAPYNVGGQLSFVTDGFSITGWNVGGNVGIGGGISRYSGTITANKILLNVVKNDSTALNLGEPYLFSVRVRKDSVSVPLSNVQIIDPFNGNTILQSNSNGECIYTNFVPSRIGSGSYPFKFVAAKSGYPTSDTVTATLSVQTDSYGGNDETDMMGICPTVITTGNGHNTLNFSREGKLVALYTPTVGSFNIIPYTTGIKNDVYAPLYNAPEFEGMFAGITIDGMFKWLWQLPLPQISHPYQDNPAIKISYSIPFDTGAVQINLLCVAGHSNDSPRANVQSYEIVNTTPLRRNVKIVYYGFVHPTVKNQQPRLGKIGNIPFLIGWDYNEPSSTDAHLDTRQILIKPNSGNGQYVSLGATLGNNNSLQQIDSTRFASFNSLINDLGVYNKSGIDLGNGSTAAQGQNVNWALLYNLDTISSNQSKMINVFISTGPTEASAKLGLTNAYSNGYSYFVGNSYLWWQKQNFLSFINGLNLSDPDKKSLKRWAITCRMLVDNDSGAIIASPNRQPKYYAVWARDAMFQSLLWELLGEKEIVDKLVKFLLGPAERYTDILGTMKMYWRQCYSILPNPNETNRSVGTPFPNNVELLKPGIVEEDQMAEFLWVLYEIANHRKPGNPKLGLPSTISQEQINQIASHIISRITPTYDPETLIGKKAGLLQPSFDWYEFPENDGTPSGISDAFKDSEKAAISQSLVTNSAAVAGLYSAYRLTNNITYSQQASAIEDVISNDFVDVSNPSEPTIRPPAYVALSTYVPPFDFITYSYVPSTRRKLDTYAFSSVWPFKVFSPSEVYTSNFIDTVAKLLGELKDPAKKCFMPAYLMYGLFQQYNHPVNESIITEVTNGLQNDSVGYVPEVFYIENHKFKGKGTKPLGWSNAWAALALLAKADIRFDDLLVTEVRVDSNKINLPKRFALSQNYPNPFNPATTFRYDLPHQSSVTLKVYNLLGQLVQTLADGVESAGYKSVEWNAGSVSSGIYFYRLSATSTCDPTKSFTQVKKMLLLK